MANVSVARRYARALIDVAAEAHGLDRVGEQLGRLAGLIQQNPELANLLSNPAYTRAQRRAVLDQVMAASQVSDPAVVNLVHLLNDRDRTPSLPDVERIYRTMADNRAGRVRGSVTSAVPLPAEALRQLSAALQQLTQRHVVLEPRVDPSLIGGVTAQVGSVVYDGSIRSQLEEMRRTLKQAS